MASKHREPLPRSKPRQNTPLLFLLLLLIPAYGGYYNFTVLLAGVILIPLLVHSALRSGAFLLPTGPEAWCLYGLCTCMLLSVPFAISTGMAFTGFLRCAVWVLFFLYAATYTPEERRQILDTVAYEGAILCLLTIAAFLWDKADGIQDVNGRVDGLFQYANTWSVFLLVCLLLLALREKRRPVDWPAMAVLLCGIFLSGSRGVFLLLFLMGAGYGLWYALRRRKLLPLLLGFGGTVLIGGLAVLLSGGMVLRRLQAITLSSSSLNGRLLYCLDGLRMILSHPLGLGRGGYLYFQPLEQTGVYTLRFIHNEYLQAALDGGWLAGLLTAALVLLLLFRKRAGPRERAVVFAVAAHAFIDFDFQFTAVVFLLLLCGTGGKVRSIPVTRRLPALLAAAALTLGLGYFSAVYFLDFAGRSDAAYTLFPADLSLAENRLQHFASVEAAVPTADRILSSTDLSMLAWDCKYADAVRRGDYPAMAEAKYHYLRLNPYRGEVYEDFTLLLENACAQGSPQELSQYISLARSAIQQLEEVNEKTSPLAYRIAEKPDLTFSTDLLARLYSITERKEIG